MGCGEILAQNADYSALKSSPRRDRKITGEKNEHKNTGKKRPYSPPVPRWRLAWRLGLSQGGRDPPTQGWTRSPHTGTRHRHRTPVSGGVEPGPEGRGGRRGRVVLCGGRGMGGMAQRQVIDQQSSITLCGCWKRAAGWLRPPPNQHPDHHLLLCCQ